MSHVKPTAVAGVLEVEADAANAAAPLSGLQVGIGTRDGGRRTARELGPSWDNASDRHPVVGCRSCTRLHHDDARRPLRSAEAIVRPRWHLAGIFPGRGVRCGKAGIVDVHGGKSMHFAGALIWPARCRTSWGPAGLGAASRARRAQDAVQCRAPARKADDRCRSFMAHPVSRLALGNLVPRVARYFDVRRRKRPAALFLTVARVTTGWRGGRGGSHGGGPDNRSRCWRVGAGTTSRRGTAGPAALRASLPPMSPTQTAPTALASTSKLVDRPSTCRTHGPGGTGSATRGLIHRGHIARKISRALRSGAHGGSPGHISMGPGLFDQKIFISGG